MSGWWPTVVRVRRSSGNPDVVLRALRMRDRAQWEALREANLSWLRPWEAVSPDAASRMVFRRLVHHYDREGRAGRSQPFCIEVEGRIVGQAQLSQMVWGSARSAQVGYWVSRDVAGQGIAPTAVAALTDHAFHGLGLHRLEAAVHPQNAASIRVMDKLGFHQEGVRRKALYVDGSWQDHLSYAITVEDLAGESAVRGWNRSHG